MGTGQRECEVSSTMQDLSCMHEWANAFSPVWLDQNRFTIASPSSIELNLLEGLLRSGKTLSGESGDDGFIYSAGNASTGLPQDDASEIQLPSGKCIDASSLLKRGAPKPTQSRCHCLLFPCRLCPFRLSPSVLLGVASVWELDLYRHLGPPL